MPEPRTSQAVELMTQFGHHAVAGAVTGGLEFLRQFAHAFAGPAQG